MGKVLLSTINGSDHHLTHERNVSKLTTPPENPGPKDLGKHGYFGVKNKDVAGSQITRWSITDNPMPDVNSSYKKAVPMPDVNSSTTPTRKSIRII